MQSRPAVRDERYVARRRHPCGTASVASRHRVVPRRPRILAPPSPRLDRYREAPRRRGRITVADNVAEQLVQQLIEAGVERIYGIVGDSLNPIVDAVRRTGGSAKGGIDWIHVRHEEAAAFAAASEAQLTGRLAVCAGSCGPGNLHLINGLSDAHR